MLDIFRVKNRNSDVAVLLIAFLTIRFHMDMYCKCLFKYYRRTKCHEFYRYKENILNEK